MSKKKSKRVDARRAIEGEMAAKRRRFYNTGAPVSLLMLVAFVVVASVLLRIGDDFGEGAVLNWRFAKAVLQVAGLTLMVSLSLGLYVLAYEPGIVKSHLRGVSLLLLLLVAVAAVRLIVLQSWPPYLNVVPVMTVAIILTVGYSQRFALAIGGFVAIVGIVAMGTDEALVQERIGVLFSSCAGMAVAVLSLKEIRTRSRLVEVCLAASIVVAGMTWAVGCWQGQELMRILWNSLWGGGAAALLGFVVQGLLPLIERLFGTATSMTLREYGEANKPLLKLLAVEAPGTFNHSWQIGMLSEAAADAIGSNGLLCRVGSYYHDVGKLNKPRYFVENQAENFNQHRELSPTMSRMIIIGHVKDGLELAREYHIPRALDQFITSHHGTTLVEYFYHEATKKGAETGHDVPETEFRYPGPKPQTKEAAIVMLADAVEGATRAMKEPTPSRIETVVNEMAMKRLQDGQFDECDLTMRDLKRIEDSLIKSLCGMYHGRIVYPKVETSGKNGRSSKVQSSSTGSSGQAESNTVGENND